jgi:hypothetical protein
MADNPKDEYPKVPPFIIKGTSGKAAKGPASQSRPPSQPPTRRNGEPSQRGMLSVLVLIISLFSLGIALLGGAWVGTDVLARGMDNQVGLVPKVLAIGLAYLVGWIISLFGSRILGNLLLPSLIRMYSYIVLAGICGLQFAIIYKLFLQNYTLFGFGKYLIMMSAGLLALIGLHLILENHSLVPYAFPIIAISLAHLFLTVIHYVFLENEEAKFVYFWGDLGFFIFTSTVGGLMVAHLGLLNGLRRWVGKIFNQKNTQFVPPK